MAFGSPASRQQDYDSLQDGTEISDTDGQDKMLLVPPVISPYATPYYAPSIGYPYVLNPTLNPVCTLRAGVMMPTMPVLQQPVYPNPNVPVYGQSYAQAPVPAQPFRQVPQQPRPPVPNPNYRPPNQGPIQRPNQQPNQYPNQGPQQPQHFGNGGRPNGGRPNGGGPNGGRPNGGRPNGGGPNGGGPNGGGQHGGGRPRYDQGGQYSHPRSDYNNQNFGDKAYGDQIEDKFIPTVVNPYPAPVPGFYDQNNMPCNPYLQTVYMQQPVVYQQPYYQQPIIVG